MRSNVLAKNDGYVLVGLLIAIALIPTLIYTSMHFVDISVKVNRFFKAGETKQRMDVVRALVISNAKDADNDGFFELLKEQAGNTLPTVITSGTTDEWGTAFRYYTWDLGSANSNGTYSTNNVAPPNSGQSGRIISAGQDKVFQTAIGSATVQGDDIAVDIYEDSVRYANAGLGGWVDNGSTIALINPADHVGIGTASPLYPLGIRGEGAAEALMSFENQSGTTKWHMNLNLIGYRGLNFAETGVADGRLFLKEGGNVGIGTFNPTGSLHVLADNYKQLKLESGQTRQPAICFNGPWSVSNYDESYAQIRAQNDNGGPGAVASASLRFATSSGDPAMLTDKMVIYGNGNTLVFGGNLDVYNHAYGFNPSPMSMGETRIGHISHPQWDANGICFGNSTNGSSGASCIARNGDNTYFGNVSSSAAMTTTATLDAAGNLNVAGSVYAPGNFGTAGRFITNAANGAFYLDRVNYLAPALGLVANGNLYSIAMSVSSKRFKENIVDLDIDTSRIDELRPVSFNYKPERGGSRDFGLIAEEVAEIFPLLTTRDENGEIFSVRYELLSAILLPEVQKLKKEVKSLTSENAELRAKNERQQATVEDLVRRVEALEAARK